MNEQNIELLMLAITDVIQDKKRTYPTITINEVLVALTAFQAGIVAVKSVLTEKGIIP